MTGAARCGSAGHDYDGVTDAGLRIGDRFRQRLAGFA
jgi:hypothetical protein